MHIWAVE